MGPPLEHASPAERSRALQHRRFSRGDQHIAPDPTALPS